MGFNSLARRRAGLCCGVVFVDEAAKDLRPGHPAAPTASARGLVVTVGRCSAPRTGSNNQQVTVAGDEHAVSALGAGRLHSAFGDAVHPRGPWCGLIDLDVLGGKNGIKRVGEDGVSVSDQVSDTGRPARRRWPGSSWPARSPRPLWDAR